MDIIGEMDNPGTIKTPDGVVCGEFMCSSSAVQFKRREQFKYGAEQDGTEG